MYYSKSWLNVSKDEFMDEPNDYIRWYNEKKIEMSLEAMSPMEFINSLGLL